MRNALFRVDKVNHGKTSFDSWNPWKHEPSSVFTPSSRCSTSFYRNMRKYLRKYLHIVSQVFWFLPCSSIFYYTPRVLTTYNICKSIYWSRFPLQPGDPLPQGSSRWAEKNSTIEVWIAGKPWGVFWSLGYWWFLKYGYPKSPWVSML